MKRVILVLALALVLIVGCAPDNPPGFDVISDESGVGSLLVRYVDTEAGVVCWVYNWKAISCLPIDQTKLEVTQ